MTMLNKFSSGFAALLLVVVFTSLVLINNTLFKGARVDLTENQIYSLSDGSKQIVSDIEEPVHLYFFYSDKASKGMTSLRNYANRVESLLEEYAAVSNGKIILHKIDPEPFSDAEDQADKYGLTGVTLSNGGDKVYLGLAGSNAYDDQKTIAFFDPQQERFLEYDISKLIYQLSHPNKVHVTLISNLPIGGGQNPMTGRQEPPWTIYTQLNQLYDVKTLRNNATSVPQNTDVLMLVDPSKLSEKLQYSIDQYAMRGGKVFVFADPHSAADPMAAMTGKSGTHMDKLLKSWGIEFDPSKVVLDAASGLNIRTQNGVARHMGYLGLQGDLLDDTDVVTSGLDDVNLASAGAISKVKGSQVSWKVLMHSSKHSDLVSTQTYSMTHDVDALSKLFRDQGKSYTLAARIAGKAKSAFDKAPKGENQKGFVASTDKLNVIVVADSDLLTDQFWGSASNFFGKRVFTPFANNGDFVTNGVENLGGSNALINIRSRGVYARPFTVVQDLTVKAEKRYRAHEQQLQKELQQTEQQLSQLQGQKTDKGALVLSSQQQKAIDQFVKKKITIRKQLREVRHQLDMAIDNLGRWLKFINIALAPLVLVLLLALVARLSRKTSRRRGA